MKQVSKAIGLDGKEYTKESIKTMMLTNKAALYRAMTLIYDYQTADEKATEDTKYNNSVGFSGRDAKIMTSFVQNSLKKYGDLKRILNASDMNKMTDHLYKVLSLQCGTIAHYNKAGWIDTYPTVKDLARVLRRNEYGNNILFDCPNWKADFKVVAREMLKLTEKYV